MIIYYNFDSTVSSLKQLPQVFMRLFLGWKPGDQIKGDFMKLKSIVFILLFALIGHVTVWASVSREQVTQIYVATF